MCSRLILLAPAINLMEFTPYRERKILMPVHIYHGRQDEVIPISDVESVAKQVFSNLTFHAVDDDHYLHKTFEKIEWDTLAELKKALHIPATSEMLSSSILMLAKTRLMFR